MYLYINTYIYCNFILIIVIFESTLLNYETTVEFEPSNISPGKHRKKNVMNLYFFVGFTTEKYICQILSYMSLKYNVARNKIFYCVKNIAHSGIYLSGLYY